MHSFVNSLSQKKYKGAQPTEDEELTLFKNSVQEKTLYDMHENQNLKDLGWNDKNEPDLSPYRLNLWNQGATGFASPKQLKLAMHSNQSSFSSNGSLNSPIYSHKNHGMRSEMDQEIKQRAFPFFGCLRRNPKKQKRVSATQPALSMNNIDPHYVKEKSHSKHRIQSELPEKLASILSYSEIDSPLLASQNYPLLNRIFPDSTNPSPMPSPAYTKSETDNSFFNRFFNHFKSAVCMIKNVCCNVCPSFSLTFVKKIRLWRLVTTILSLSHVPMLSLRLAFLFIGLMVTPVYLVYEYVTIPLLTVLTVSCFSCYLALRIFVNTFLRRGLRRMLPEQWQAFLVEERLCDHIIRAANSGHFGFYFSRILLLLFFPTTEAERVALLDGWHSFFVGLLTNQGLVNMLPDQMKQLYYGDEQFSSVKNNKSTLNVPSIHQHHTMQSPSPTSFVASPYFQSTTTHQNTQESDNGTIPSPNSTLSVDMGLTIDEPFRNGRAPELQCDTIEDTTKKMFEHVEKTELKSHSLLNYAPSDTEKVAFCKSPAHFCLLKASRVIANSRICHGRVQESKYPSVVPVATKILLSLFRNKFKVDSLWHQTKKKALQISFFCALFTVIVPFRKLRLKLKRMPIVATIWTILTCYLYYVCYGIPKWIVKLVQCVTQKRRRVYESAISEVRVPSGQNSPTIQSEISSYSLESQQTPFDIMPQPRDPFQALSYYAFKMTWNRNPK